MRTLLSLVLFLIFGVPLCAQPKPKPPKHDLANAKEGDWVEYDMTFTISGKPHTGVYKATVTGFCAGGLQMSVSNPMDTRICKCPTIVPLTPGGQMFASPSDPAFVFTKGKSTDDKIKVNGKEYETVCTEYSVVYNTKLKTTGTTKIWKSKDNQFPIYVESTVLALGGKETFTYTYELKNSGSKK